MYVIRVFQQTLIYQHTLEVLATCETREEAYDLENFLLNAPDFTTAKVFGVLMTQQKFEGGINTTKKTVADRIKISYRSVGTAFKWFKEHGYIKERKENSRTVPDYRAADSSRKGILSRIAI